MNNGYCVCVAIGLLVFTAAARATGHARPAPIVIQSVKVSFPTSTSTFAPGPGAELSGKCLICHSAGMVLKQPQMSQEGWRKEIIKMREVYGAPIDDADIEPLTAYISKVNAAQQSKK